MSTANLYNIYSPVETPATNSLFATRLAACQAFAKIYDPAVHTLGGAVDQDGDPSFSPVEPDFTDPEYSARQAVIEEFERIQRHNALFGGEPEEIEISSSFSPDEPDYSDREYWEMQNALIYHYECLRKEKVVPYGVETSVWALANSCRTGLELEDYYFSPYAPPTPPTMTPPRQASPVGWEQWQWVSPPSPMSVPVSQHTLSPVGSPEPEWVSAASPSSLPLPEYYSPGSPRAGSPAPSCSFSPGYSRAASPAPSSPSHEFPDHWPGSPTPLSPNYRQLSEHPELSGFWPDSGMPSRPVSPRFSPELSAPLSPWPAWSRFVPESSVPSSPLPASPRFSPESPVPASPYYSPLSPRPASPRFSPESPVPASPYYSPLSPRPASSSFSPESPIPATPYYSPVSPRPSWPRFWPESPAPSRPVPGSPRFWPDSPALRPQDYSAPLAIPASPRFWPESPRFSQESLPDTPSPEDWPFSPRTPSPRDWTPMTDVPGPSRFRRLDSPGPDLRAQYNDEAWRTAPTKWHSELWDLQDDQPGCDGVFAFGPPLELPVASQHKPASKRKSKFLCVRHRQRKEEQVKSAFKRKAKRVRDSDSDSDSDPVAKFFEEHGMDTDVAEYLDSLDDGEFE